MPSTAAAMVAKAASQVGVREGRDPDGNWNNRQKYGDWYADSIKNNAFRAVAWCDIFVSWCAEFSGNADIIPKCAYVPSRLNYYRAQNRTGNFPPAPGDLGIVLINGVAQHIFIVEKWLGDYVQTIEGNTNEGGSAQGNGVYRLKRRDWSTNPNIVYCRPAYASTMSKPTTVPTTSPTKPSPIPVPAPAGKDTNVTISDADAQKVALAVLGYKNAEVNGSKDVYQLLTDGSLKRDQIASPTKAASNPTWTTESYLRESFILIDRLVKIVTGLQAETVANRAAIEALANNQSGVDPATTQKIMSDAVAKALSSLRIVPDETP